MARNSFTALGLDPGFADFGWAKVNIYAYRADVPAMGVIRTEKSAAKRNVLAVDDNLRRTFEIYDNLSSLFEGVSVVCVESMSFPRNSSAAAKVAMTWGVMASLVKKCGVPLLQVSPQAIKKAVCKKNNASKEEVESAVKSIFPFKAGLLEDVAPSHHNHAWDALAAVHACMDSDVMRALKQAVK